MTRRHLPAVLRRMSPVRHPGRSHRIPRLPHILVLLPLMVAASAMGPVGAAAQNRDTRGADASDADTVRLQVDDDICVTEPAPTLREGHPFQASTERVRGDRGGVMGGIVIEEVRLDEDLTVRIEGKGCTYYEVDYVLLLPDPGVLARAGGGEWEREREGAARLARALRILEPHDVSAIDLPRVAALIEEALAQGGAATLMERRVDVSDNELGEFFVLTRECDPGPEAREACRLRLRAVIGL